MVGVVFANQAGLVNDPPVVQRIEIVDAKLTGTISGKVTYGERLQPGVGVSLFDADNKLKAATTTSDKGVFTFEKVPLASYKVVAIKKDSSTGAAGITAVQVDAEHTPKKPAIANITLNKIRQ